jgi:hypothetical protein
MNFQKQFLLIFFKVIVFSALAQHKQSVLIVHNKQKLEYEISYDFTSKRIRDSKRELDTFVLNSPYHNTDIEIYVNKPGEYFDRTFRADTDTIRAEVSDSVISVPATSYNEDLDKLVKLIRTTYSRDSIMKYSNEELDGRVKSKSREFLFKYPKSENTLGTLLIDGRCNGMSNLLIDSIAAFWDKEFFEQYKEARIVLKFKDRIFFKEGDAFPLHKFIDSATIISKSKKPKLIMIAEPDCGFTEHWLIKLKPHLSYFGERYYFHVEKSGFNKDSITQGFKDVYIEQSDLNEDLLRTKACAIPYFIILNHKNIIEHFGSGKEMMKLYFTKKE